MEITAKKISYTEKIYFMAYNAGKKILHPCMSRKFLSPEVWGKNYYTNKITHTPSQKSNGQPLG